MDRERLVLEEADVGFDLSEAASVEVVERVAELGTYGARLWLEAALAKALLFACNEAVALALVEGLRDIGEHSGFDRQLVIEAIQRLAGAQAASAALVGELGEEAGRDALEAVLVDPDFELVAAALGALCRLGVEASSTAIDEALPQWHDPRVLLDSLPPDSLEELVLGGSDGLRVVALERLDVADHEQGRRLAEAVLQDADGELWKLCGAILAVPDGEASSESTIAASVMTWLEAEVTEIDANVAGPGWGEPTEVALLCDADDCVTRLHAMTRQLDARLPEVALICASCGNARPLLAFDESTIVTVVAELSSPLYPSNEPSELDDTPRELPSDEQSGGRKLMPARIGPPKSLLCDACSQPIAPSGRCGCS